MVFGLPIFICNPDDSILIMQNLHGSYNTLDYVEQATENRLVHCGHIKQTSGMNLNYSDTRLVFVMTVGEARVQRDLNVSFNRS